MLTVEQVRAMLQDRRIDIVAAATGLHRNTIANIRAGRGSLPSYTTLEKLSDYLTSVPPRQAVADEHEDNPANRKESQ